jgi:hypothetical protein
MKNKESIRKTALSAMFVAIGMVLPFLTGQIPEIGNLLLPMHIPALLCGYICGAPWGLAAGFLMPVLRSLIIGFPAPFFPRAIAMAFELATYGFLAGLLYRRLLPQKKYSIYLSLAISMVAGRIVWGIVQLICAGFDFQKFNLSIFWAGAFAEAIPGIVLQFALIPVIILIFDKNKFFKK